MNPNQSNGHDQNPAKESNPQGDEIVNSEQPEHPQMGAKNQVTSYKGMTEETNTLTEKSGGAMKSPVDSKDDDSVKEDDPLESNDSEMRNEADEFSDEEKISEERDALEDDNGDRLERNGEQVNKESNKSSL